MVSGHYPEVDPTGSMIVSIEMPCFIEVLKPVGISGTIANRHCESMHNNYDVKE